MWISVHDSIDGPKLRDLCNSLSCSKFEATGILVFLWQWGLNNANEHGLILDADEEDIERYLYGFTRRSKLKAPDIITALISSGWIDRIEDKLYLHDWEVWQKEWYKYKNRLKKDSERKRNKILTQKDKPEEKQKAEDNSAILRDKEPEKPKEKNEEKTVKKKQVDYSEQFLKFWDLYPRKDDKSEAYKCFVARTKEGTKPEKLLQAATAYAEICRKERKEKQYIMLAKTFLGPNLRFADYLPKQKPVEPPKGNNPFDGFLTEDIEKSFFGEDAAW